MSIRYHIAIWSIKAHLEFFGNLAEEYGFTIDTSGKDGSRLCYLAHNPLVIVKANAIPIEWDCEAYLKAEKEKQERFDAAAKIPYTAVVDITALDHIDPNDLDYNQWLSVLTACKVAGLTWQQADAWSRRGGVRYTEAKLKTMARGEPQCLMGRGCQPRQAERIQAADTNESETPTSR